MWKRINFGEGDYTSAKFVEWRMGERQRFAPGVEIEIEFEGRDVFQGFAMARRAAMVYAGLLTMQKGSDETKLFVSDMGPYQGHVVGSQSLDTKRGWRIDFHNEKFHVNWWDRRKDTSPQGTKDKTKSYFGANFVRGGGQDLFWQVESHFPRQIEPKRR